MSADNKRAARELGLIPKNQPADALREPRQGGAFDMHEPKLYAAEGPVTGHEGKFTVASVGCTCGWNSDGKSWNKEGDWHAHLPKLAAPATPLSGEQVRKLWIETWGTNDTEQNWWGSPAGITRWKRFIAKLNVLLRQPAEAERDRRVPHFSDDVTTYSSFGDAYNHGYKDGEQRGFRAAKEMAAQLRCVFCLATTDKAILRDGKWIHYRNAVEPTECEASDIWALEDAGKVSGGEQH